MLQEHKIHVDLAETLRASDFQFGLTKTVQMRFCSDFMLQIQKTKRILWQHKLEGNKERLGLHLGYASIRVLHKQIAIPKNAGIRSSCYHSALQSFLEDR